MTMSDFLSFIRLGLVLVDDDLLGESVLFDFAIDFGTCDIWVSDF